MEIVNNGRGPEEEREGAWKIKHDPMQRRARACVPARRSALRREDPERPSLRLTSRSWPPQMPNARLWPRRRRAPRGGGPT